MQQGIVPLRKGDVVACATCGYTYLWRKAAGAGPACRRCRSPDVSRWKPLALA